MNQQRDLAHLPAVIEPIEDAEGLGPKMRALNPRQRAFVEAFVLTGGQNGKQAAAMSGFGGTEGSQRQAAHRLLHTQAILAAIKERADAQIRSNILVGTGVLVEIANDPTHKDRLKAATQLIDRGGLIIQQQLNVHVTDETSNSDVIDRIRTMAGKLGIDPAVLLGRFVGSKTALPAPLKVVDAEFTPVEDTDEWTV